MSLPIFKIMDILEKLEHIAKLDVWDLTLDLLAGMQTEIVNMNKEQMLEGKTSEGKGIEPNYKNDPFFKTELEARRYAIYKKIKTPNSKRGFWTPNMFIDGRLVHNQMTAFREGDELVITPTGEAASFDQKYKNIYGLTEENIGNINEKLIPKIQDEVRRYLQI